MSEALKQLIAEIQTTFRDQPDKAKVTFESQSRLQDGFHSEVALRHHTVTVDEPAELGGTDKGPNPVELVLASLGSCQEITYRAYAAALGIPLESVSVKLEGDMDLRGFFAVADHVRPGYQAIRGTVELTSSASEEQLQTLREVVNAHCPVLDILTKPVPVALELRVNEAVASWDDRASKDLTRSFRELSGAVPVVPDAIGRGDFGPLMARLGEKLHGLGAPATTDALIEHATGQPLDPKIFEASLRARYLGES